MSSTGPLEILADAAGSVTFGWADEGVFYARFTRCLSARLGEAYAARLRAAVSFGSPIRYFSDARALESYDLLARSAFVRVVTEHRRKFEQLNVLTWPEGEVNAAFVQALGEPLLVTRDAVAFETLLLRTAPAARAKLAARPDSPHRSRWPLRR